MRSFLIAGKRPFERRPALALLLSLVASLSLVGCADRTPPTFDVGAKLELSGLEPTSATVKWLAARDDRAVVGYRLRLDGVELDSLKGAIRSHRLEGLDDNRAYVVSLEAFDEAGNHSTRLELRFETPDGTAPSFASDAQIVFDMPTGPAALAEGEMMMKLHWPAADDEVGVARYRVVKDGTELVDTDPDTTSFAASIEDVMGHYEIEACDAAGNCSAPLGASYPDFRLETGPDVPLPQGELPDAPLPQGELPDAPLPQGDPSPR